MFGTGLCGSVWGFGSGLGEFQEAAAGGGDQPFVVQHPVLDERLGDTSDLRSVQALAKIRISGNLSQQACLLGAQFHLEPLPFRHGKLIVPE